MPTRGAFIGHWLRFKPNRMSAPKLQGGWGLSEQRGLGPCQPSPAPFHPTQQCVQAPELLQDQPQAGSLRG